MKKNLPILFILILAAVLRFWNFNALCFSYDELNAMGRTIFTNFTDLWNYGIKVDAHPPLVQLWLYYYGKFFGDAEPATKLPFILCGTASVYFAYRIAQKWYNETTALLSAAFLACIQYTIMYSQIARPYSSGMFFAVMATWHWWNWLEAGRQRNLYLYILFSALCAWNHYFSFLFAAMLGFSGFFFIQKNILKKYLLAGIAIIALCLPAFPVYVFQLTNGNIGGWLGEPSWDFYLQFFHYVFHFSVLLYIVTALIFTYGLFTLKRNEFFKANKFRLLCLAWSLIPFLIAFIYSKNVSPIIQYSTLIFSFPFTVMLLFSFFSERKLLINALLVSLLCTTSVFSLVSERKHYSYFYKQPFDAMIRNTIKLQDSLGEQNVSVYLNAETYFKYYYEKKYKRYIKTLSRQEMLNVPFFKRQLDSVNTNYFIIANPHAEYKELIRNKYPELIYRDFGNTFNYFCYAKKITGKPVYPPIFETVTNCDTTSRKPGWEYNTQKIIVDTIFSAGKTVFKYNSGDEYGFGWNGKLFNIISDRSNWINASAEFLFPDSVTKAVLVFELKEGDKNIVWRGQDFEVFAPASQKWQSVHLTIDLNDIQEKLADPEIKIYVWNAGKGSILIRKMSVYVEEGNKNLFKMLDKMK